MLIESRRAASRIGRRGERRDGRRPGHPAPGVRLRLLPRPPAGDHRASHRGRRRARADADRRRQVALLPDSRAGPPRHRGGHLPADRADAGPGGRHAGARRPGRLPELHPGTGRAARDGVRVPGRRPGPALPGPGATAHRVHRGAARPGHGLAVRHRRGALRVPVGARLPPRLPHPVRAARALAAGAPHRADRHRHRRHPGRDRGPARPGWRASFRGQLRPPQHQLPDSAQG